jgi:hypothetical protein
VDGGTVWKCLSQIGASQTISTSTSTAGGSAQQRLRIEIRTPDSTNAEVSFFLNGNPLLDAAGSSRPGTNAIKHVYPIASALAMTPVLYAKAGAAFSEVLKVDYAGAFALR